MWFQMYAGNEDEDEDDKWRCYDRLDKVIDEYNITFFFFSSRRRHTRSDRDWSSDVCSSDLRDRLTSFAGCSWGVGRSRSWSGWPSCNGGSTTTWPGSRTTSGWRPTWHCSRSEERRVGKEGRSRGSPDH